MLTRLLGTLLVAAVLMGADKALPFGWANCSSALAESCICNTPYTSAQAQAPFQQCRMQAFMACSWAHSAAAKPAPCASSPQSKLVYTHAD